MEGFLTRRVQPSSGTATAFLADVSRSSRTPFPGFPRKDCSFNSRPRKSVQLSAGKELDTRCLPDTLKAFSKHFVQMNYNWTFANSQTALER